ncbi:adhesion G-protein coupled receptor G6-like [Paramacrobiotus metropolitanus]|uniref:adhesion G-protein coupled receptor G6-like n=1 Tax=Paramacrobiotus metropolitanus TaxID=2943436 RepID=UPI0024455FF0|nr:adhesion G-protein coupled receptor G6-like [Paramacrobiotus metropolitanus]
MGCGGCITVPATGTVVFSSPVGGTGESDAPGDYPNFAYCLWTFQGPTGKQLQFTEDPSVPFNLNDDCGTDTLRIGSDQYCSSNVFTTQTVSNPTVVIFTSDVSLTASGWKINVQAV